MPKYKYKFSDGTFNEVEVSEELYALLKAMDEQEKRNNRYQGRRNVPLEVLLKKDEDDKKDKG